MDGFQLSARGVLKTCLHRSCTSPDWQIEASVKLHEAAQVREYFERFRWAEPAAVIAAVCLMRLENAEQLVCHTIYCMDSRAAQPLKLLRRERSVEARHAHQQLCRKDAGPCACFKLAMKAMLHAS